MIATPGLACPFDRLQVDLKGSDAEVLKQLEERTKLNRDALFRRKKELQRVVTDYEEDVRRLEQVKAQSDKMSKQQEHLQHAKGQVEEELVARQGQLDELADRMLKQVTKHRKKLADSGADAGSMANGSLEEKAVKAEVYKDVIQVRGSPSSATPLTVFVILLERAVYPGPTGGGVPGSVRDAVLPSARGRSPPAEQATCQRNSWRGCPFVQRDRQEVRREWCTMHFNCS